MPLFRFPLRPRAICGAVIVTAALLAAPLVPERGHAAAAATDIRISAREPSPSEPDERTPAPVLIFSVELERVVQALPNTPDIQAQAARWLSTAGSISGRLQVGGSSGLIVRIPIHPGIRVKLPTHGFDCEELLVLIPSPARTQENPQLLAFSGEGRIYVFDMHREDVQPFTERYELQQWLQPAPPYVSSPK